MDADKEITILIHCHHLPGTRFEERDDVRLGIQKGKDVIEDVPADAESVTFVVPLRVTSNARNGQPNFLGPFAQGTPNERFLYLCWGQRTAAGWDGFRRAKILLKHLDWQRVEEASRSGAPIEISLDMTDAKGGPLCGSVK